MFEPVFASLREYIETVDGIWGSFSVLFNKTASRTSGSHCKDISVNMFDSITQMISDVRSIAPDSAWPVEISINWSKKQGHFAHLDLATIRLCKSRTALTDHPDLWIGSRSTYGTDRWQYGIEKAFDALRQIESALPATNQPTKAWSHAHNIMGVNHVASEGLHARTKLEYLLKSELFLHGPEHLSNILETGRLPLRRNDDHIWLVSEDLTGLDDDPEGRRDMLLDANEEFSSIMSQRRETQIEP